MFSQGFGRKRSATMIRRVTRTASRIGMRRVKIVFSVFITQLLIPKKSPIKAGSVLSLCFERGGKVSASTDFIYEPTKNPVNPLNNVQRASDAAIPINEKLELVATLYMDPVSGKFQEKSAKILLRKLKQHAIAGVDAHKGIALCDFDLHALANELGYDTFISKDIFLPLARLQGASIEVTVSARVLRTMNADGDYLDDGMSVGSIISDASDMSDGGLGATFRFGDLEGQRRGSKVRRVLSDRFIGGERYPGSFTSNGSASFLSETADAVAAANSDPVRGTATVRRSSGMYVMDVAYQTGAAGISTPPQSQMRRHSELASPNSTVPRAPSSINSSEKNLQGSAATALFPHTIEESEVEEDADTTADESANDTAAHDASVTLDSQGGKLDPESASGKKMDHTSNTQSRAMSADQRLQHQQEQHILNNQRQYSDEGIDLAALMRQRIALQREIKIRQGELHRQLSMDSDDDEDDTQIDDSAAHFDTAAAVESGPVAESERTAEIPPDVDAEIAQQLPLSSGEHSQSYSIEVYSYSMARRRGPDSDDDENTQSEQPEEVFVEDEVVVAARSSADEALLNADNDGDEDNGEGDGDAEKDDPAAFSSASELGAIAFASLTQNRAEDSAVADAHMDASGESVWSVMQLQQQQKYNAAVFDAYRKELAARDQQIADLQQQLRSQADGYQADIVQLHKELSELKADICVQAFTGQNEGAVDSPEDPEVTDAVITTSESESGNNVKQKRRPSLLRRLFGFGETTSSSSVEQNKQGAERYAAAIELARAIAAQSPSAEDAMRDIIAEFGRATTELALVGRDLHSCRQQLQCSQKEQADAYDAARCAATAAVEAAMKRADIEQEYREMSDTLVSLMNQYGQLQLDFKDQKRKNQALKNRLLTYAQRVTNMEVRYSNITVDDILAATASAAGGGVPEDLLSETLSGHNSLNASPTRPTSWRTVPTPAK